MTMSRILEALDSLSDQDILGLSFETSPSSKAGREFAKALMDVYKATEGLAPAARKLLAGVLAAEVVLVFELSGDDVFDGYQLLKAVFKRAEEMKARAN